MVEYKCFDCNKKVGADYLRKKVRCPYCGSKMLFKPRNVRLKQGKMADVSKETEQKIAQLQLMEQNLQSFLLQRQQFQSQLIEVESALKEIENTKESYKIIGNVMVNASKEDLKKDLEEKKGILELRIKSLEKQEKQIKEKATKTQAEVLEKIKEK
jgi:prefoldin beta subunit